MVIFPRDCLGFGKLTENQLMAVVSMVKAQGRLNQAPPNCAGRGIVIAGGGKYLSWAWCNAKHLRSLGTKLPIQVWHLGPEEMPPWTKELFTDLDVETVDAFEVRKTSPIRTLDGWTLKAFSVMNCPWEQVMFCDADSFLQIQPEEVFNHQEVRKVGSLFFSDVKNCHDDWGYVFCGLPRQPREMETGQFVIHKKMAWMALRWWFWLSEHRKSWDGILFGDKGWAEMGLRLSGVPFIWSQENSWEDFGISQKWKGKEYWQHVMQAKRNEAPFPAYIAEYFQEWDRLALKKSP